MQSGAVEDVDRMSKSIALRCGAKPGHMAVFGVQFGKSYLPFV